MHMADALLSPEVGLSFIALSGATLAYSAKKLREEKDEKKIPLMGVLGAFVFAAQMINFTIPGTGSSGHLVGGVLLMMILGPYSAFIVLSSVLLVQALFFADGGLLALGANIWNMGFYTAFVGNALYKLIAGKKPSWKKVSLSALLIPVLTLQMGALTVVLQTKLSGISELPFDKFVLLMSGIHLPIGIIEGLITVAVLNFVYRLRPEIIQTSLALKPQAPGRGLSYSRVVLIFLGLALLCGGIFAWFASAHPDGLEWSIERVYGKTELPEPEKGIIPFLARIQEKLSFLPDYDFKATKPESEQEADTQNSLVSTGTTVSGIIGSLIVLSFTLILGFVLWRLRGKEKSVKL